MYHFELKTNLNLKFSFLGKRAGSDKKLYKNMEKQYQESFDKSPTDKLSQSPFGYDFVIIFIISFLIKSIFI